MLLRILSLCLLLGAAQAAEYGVLLTNTELRSKPTDNAPISAQLAAQSPVALMQRQGSWVRVQNKNQQGWLKVFQIGTPSTRSSGDSGPSPMINRNNSGSSGQSSATGIAGASAGNLRHLAPNPEAAQKLDRYRANHQQAQQLAKQRRLISHQLDYLKAN